MPSRYKKRENLRLFLYGKSIFLDYFIKLVSIFSMWFRSQVNTSCDLSTSFEVMTSSPKHLTSFDGILKLTVR